MKPVVAKDKLWDAKDMEEYSAMFCALAPSALDIIE